MTRLIWLVKNTPLFIFNVINVFLLLAMCLGYIMEIAEPSLPWGTEGLGWYWKNPWNYTFYFIMWVILLVTTIYFSFKLRHKHLFWATIVSFSSVVGFIVDYMCKMEELTGQMLPFL